MRSAVRHLLAEEMDEESAAELRLEPGRLRRHGGFEPVDVLNFFIFHRIREPFLLHSRHIEDVGVAQVDRQRGGFRELNAVRLEDFLVDRRHHQLLGRGEDEFRIEVAHRLKERMYSAPVLEVSDHGTEEP